MGFWPDSLRLSEGDAVRTCGIDLGEHGLGFGFSHPWRARYLPKRKGESRRDFCLRAVSFVLDHTPGDAVIVIEEMQIDARTGTAEARALLGLQRLGGYLDSLFTISGRSVVWVPAGEWTRGVPKDVRRRRLEADLDFDLQMPPRYSRTGGRSSDAMDGLGVAHWARLQGRLVSEW